jgi:hypothetical protein
MNAKLIEADLRVLEHPEIAELDAAATKLDEKLAAVETVRDEIRSDLSAKVAAVRAAERAEQQARADAVRSEVPASKGRSAAEIERAEKAIATLREKLARAEADVVTHQRALGDQERELEAARVRLMPELREAAQARHWERGARDHQRLAQAVEDLDAARAAVIVDHGRAPIGLTTLPVQAPNGSQHHWDTVIAAMRQNVDPDLYAQPEPGDPVVLLAEPVTDTEILAWHIANGGDTSDSYGTVQNRYVEHGPRRDLLARQLAARDGQRTWPGVTA